MFKNKKEIYCFGYASLQFTAFSILFVSIVCHSLYFFLLFFLFLSLSLFSRLIWWFKCSVCINRWFPCDTQCRTLTVTYKKRNMHTGFCGRFNLLNDMFSFIFLFCLSSSSFDHCQHVFAGVNFIIFILFWHDVIGE